MCLMLGAPVLEKVWEAGGTLATAAGALPAVAPLPLLREVNDFPLKVRKTSYSPDI